MLGIAISNPGAKPQVFLYYTESQNKDGDDEARTQHVHPLGNRVYRYDLVDGKLDLNLNPLQRSLVS
jgi:hypothetical protein